MRYRFYRVHKYVCYELAEFDRESARTDFSDPKACLELKEKLFNLTRMLKHHGDYEDAHIHNLLRQKNSCLQLLIEREHLEHEQVWDALFQHLEKIMEIDDYSEKILEGNQFHLSYRLFYSEMLKHLYDEEKILLPELQALYTDKELAKLQALTYQKMTPDDMLGMLSLLFPHANQEDMSFFTEEMKAAEPAKFAIVWEKLSNKYKQTISAHSLKTHVYS